MRLFAPFLIAALWMTSGTNAHALDDAGTPGFDSGIGPGFDSGIGPGFDAGTGLSDSGTGLADSGTIRFDSGTGDDFGRDNGAVDMGGGTTMMPGMGPGTGGTPPMTTTSSNPPPVEGGCSMAGGGAQTYAGLIVLGLAFLWMRRSCRPARA